MLKPSPLERALLAVLHELYVSQGFPPPEKIRVLRRENTGVGRFVDLHANVQTEMDDGYYDLGGHYIEMEGVHAGMSAVIRIGRHMLEQLEIAVYGDEPWDGEEHRWSAH
jgi:hypothetical protein